LKSRGSRIVVGDRHPGMAVDVEYALFSLRTELELVTL
jgi:hypothetical protein